MSSEDDGSDSTYVPDSGAREAKNRKGKRGKKSNEIKVTRKSERRRTLVPRAKCHMVGYDSDNEAVYEIETIQRWFIDNNGVEMVVVAWTATKT
eukprot:CAMPEP_0176014380 /NCGR_PEP_ID=MMETSP0120_2-20121206/6794_1 /TAXON_ID=160619 /ORGANISM="Kryptoperidinium foliaceum, Strain CCMP 1326" /LENGTH=93 /DNA_ID=CAMNT_0017347321 /DNA_START=365 /DNA_END=643 /DNA_ORIENTATION=+